MSFEMTKGVEDLVSSAIKKEDAGEEYSFSLEGDLQQMSSQKVVLISKGFDIKQRDVYPSLRICDKKPALKVIWESKVSGWFHYMKDMVELGVCTEDEWKEAILK